jgi:hypothetical protein
MNRYWSLVFGIALTMSAGSAMAQNTFPSSGNVGIGTTTPSAALTIAADGPDLAPQLLIQGSTNWAYQLRLGYDTTNNIGWVQASQSGLRTGHSASTLIMAMY